MACCKEWLTGTNFFVYISHFLSAWGDRMWAFGVGLFLIEIASKSLQLTAIYGLCSAFTYLFFGALVGDWVDKTARLKAAQISLALQNIFVICCAAVVYVHLWFMVYIKSQWNGWMLILSYAVIIILAILGNMASMARTIAVEKDWIVEICGRDKDMLAQMTSTLRRIDLATKILAPIATGQIMTYVGLEFGAVFIGGWNLVTVFIEYYLIWKVYQTVPALRKKKDLSKHDDRETVVEEVELKEETLATTDVDVNAKEISSEDNRTDGIPEESSAEIQVTAEEAAVEETKHGKDIDFDDEKKDKEKDCSDDSKTGKGKVVSKESKDGGCKFGKGFITLYRGWRTYLHYGVCNAGLGLACLYMTVLGFDNITVGYAYSQNISESILGFLMGGAAIVGIVGTFAYPFIRRRIGLERTGLFALTAQITCLIPCVVSVFMPGSPFDILHRSKEPILIETNCSVSAESAYNATNQLNVTLINVTVVTDNVTNSCIDESDSSFSYISIALLMTGIITARFGLWTADLTITQLFLENVEEQERGIVNGVQQSLNRLMDLFKFAMVVAAPEPQLFGFLVFISFGSVCLGAVLYATYSRKARGHLFHFEKVIKCVNNNEQYVTSVAA
ncbi:solute carrier family 40 member 1 isoform X2 [Patella vulgata]|uniref:solute carrier family 40 member 1 isoform X2 n=1 Tax=Patella vulgata TaxID=6465 RepID=UPI0021807F22|nr:solute carrier family 40 member 1 isoform X2 [Patella vulgata]